MIYTLKEGNSKQTFEGFRAFKAAKSPKYLIIAIFDGESDLYEWDSSDLGVEELLRYYRYSYDREPEMILRYSFADKSFK
jgi:hypothetical protein